MKIGVIGNGVVGNATARCFMEHAEVRVFDRVAERRTHGLMQTLDSSIVFVCVPEGQLDSVFREMPDRLGNFAIKSTCPIGTTRKLAEKYGLKNLVHSPEFLTARCAVTDAQLPARNIIGIPNRMNLQPDSDGYERSICGEALDKLYEKRFPGVPIHLMTSDESEAVKLIQNSFFAVKVAFFNEVNELAQRLGLDWEVIRAALLADGRIAHSHTQVPGPDGKYGFGGACLPKDLTQLITQMHEAGTNYGVCTAALDRNEHDRERIK